MTLAMFFFGFVAWFFASIDQNRYKQKNEAVFQILTQNFDCTNESLSDTLLNPYHLFISKSDFEDDERLIIQETSLRDRSNNSVYENQIWLVNQ